MRRLLYSIIALLIVNFANAQMWGGGMGGGGFKQANVGHFYGKVVDSITGKPVPFAAVQLTGPKWDSVTQSTKQVILTGQLTSDNGEFSLEKLPVMGPFTLQISSIGYGNYQKIVGFNLGKLMKQKQKGLTNGDDNSSNPASSIESMVGAIDRDLGNIKLQPDASTQLKTVTVDGAGPPMELKLDKRVFDVSKNITTSGGTAEDVLKNIPAVNVDIDGNVTLRNSSPTIYVDGMPTTLTIDQIPADEIDKIEVITNPSAKYDASAGTGGIINIVMKHNKSLGYNGSVRGGIDEYGKLTGGLDLNIRQGKFNVFADAFFKQIKHKMYGNSTKDTAGEPAPFLNTDQIDTNTMNGYFGFLRAGFDYFIDNRNTITVTGTYGIGNFSSQDLLHTTTDTLHPLLPFTYSTSYENSLSQRNFQHDGVSVLYKHLFPKDEENITASINMDQGKSSGNSLSSIQNYNSNNDLFSSVNEQQASSGVNTDYTLKADFTDPLTKKIKLDAGVMATLNQVNTTNNIYINDILFGNESSDFTYNQQIYAAYISYSQDISSRLSGQAAVRVEQSMYSGQLTDTTTTTLPTQSLLYFFPSAFLTYHLNEKSDLQLSYTTHINRPGFNQLVVNNYSNPQNVQLANPNLKPAYMNSFELNYMNSFDRKNSILVSAYYKLTYNLITNQLISSDYNPELQLIQYTSTYQNANYAFSRGLELTSQNSISDWLDLTANINFFESGINATNLNVPDTAKQFLSYFAKLNVTFKLPKNISIQINGNYLSKAQIPPGGSGGGRWGGMGGYGGITPSAQGYVLPNYWLDAAVKMDFLKNKKASVTVNVKDIFGTAYNKTTLLATSPEGSPLYYQTTSRHRDPQFISLTLSYKFGQTDLSLFKKKNNNIAPDQSSDMGGGGE
ncbi:MAG TPA: outer membrane beta-barrel family protein [Bacteroidia bacterium]|jgi:outer membrane cobalamin receptor|nr:outer membrane beta-barrel family protein [Bacteroidia bacterium]